MKIETQCARRRVEAGSASSNGRSVISFTANGPRTLVPYGSITAGESKFSRGVYNRFLSGKDQSNTMELTVWTNIQRRGYDPKWHIPRKLAANALPWLGILRNQKLPICLALERRRIQTN
jgi:hypothetical protein